MNGQVERMWEYLKIQVELQQIAPLREKVWSDVESRLV